MSKSKSKILAIYSDERLTLTGDMATEHLIIHLGTQPTRINLNGYALSWDTIEFIGSGSFEIYNGADLVDVRHSS